MDDETKEWIVRAVLLFCAIVIAGVSVYTTFMLFQTYEIDINFSPPDNVAQFSPPVEEEEKATGYFDFEKEKGGERFKNEEIKPADRTGVINPLVIFEEVDGDDRIIVFILMVLELFVIIVLFWRLDRAIVNKHA